MTAMSTAPNSAVPIGARRRPTVDELADMMPPDAEKLTLYVHRPLVNADALIAWARAAGFKTTLAADDMHATIAYSKAPVDWDALDPEEDPITVAPGARQVTPLGDEGAIVLKFTSPDLQARWKEFGDAGATWDYPTFQPHVTISYDAGDVDLAKVTPFDLPLEFGPETFGEVQSDWTPKEVGATDADPPGVKHDPSSGQFTSGGGGSGPKDPPPERTGHADPVLEKKKAALAGHADKHSKLADEAEAAGEKSTAEAHRKAATAYQSAHIELTKKHARTATDSALRLALDRASVRSVDRDGRMRVAVTNISKAAINPYKGSEIPDWERLGLDPERIYNLFRDPEELAKAAPTFNGVQLLKKHTPVSAADHRKHDIIGTSGTEARFEAPFLKNSLVVWSQEGIDLIESGEQCELSCGYHYRPDMTPGNFDGKPFDGVMRDIEGNHITVVEDGRAGPDVVVGDSSEGLQDMSNRTLAEKIHAVSNRMCTVGALVAYLKPRIDLKANPKLATDAKPFNLGAILGDVTGKNFASKKGDIVTKITAAVTPLLAKDASIADLDKVVDSLAALEGKEGTDEIVTPEQHGAMEAAASAAPAVEIPKPAGDETAPMRDFLKSKGMGEDDINTACGMMKPKAADEAESDEDKKKREAAEKEKADKEANDKKATDAMKDMVTKPAMDAAIRAVQENERGIRVALGEVRPWIGELPPTLAFDSAAAVYRHVLTARGVPGADKMHADALRPVLESLPKAGAKPAAQQTPMAADAKSVSAAVEIAPGLARIRAA